MGFFEPPQLIEAEVYAEAQTKLRKVGHPSSMRMIADQRDMRLARRMAGIAPFRVMEILARARELEALGRQIVHMEIGEPDFPTPEPVRRAGAAAIGRGDMYYTPALGLPALREAIAGYYRSRYGVAVAP